MEKKNKIILIVIIILTVGVLLLCGYLLINGRNINFSDASKFRKEYMELNDSINENGQMYPYVSISEDNNIKYLSEKEAVKMLTNGTGVIYFGFKTCPWCRTLISPLLEVAKKKNEVIYYLDIEKIRSTFEVDNNEINQIKKGTENYYKILDLLSDELEDYYLVDNEGNHLSTGEKRIYAPTLVAVKDGKIKNIHVGTITSQLSGYDEITSEQKEELEKIISDLIDSKNIEDVCEQNNC